MVFIYSSNKQEDNPVKTYLRDLDKRRDKVIKSNTEDMREFYEKGKKKNIYVFLNKKLMTLKDLQFEIQPFVEVFESN